MRILWASNHPHLATGYGVQTALTAPRLQQLGHEIALFAFCGQEGHVGEWNGMPVYPRGAHPYGEDMYAAHAGHWQADIVITLIDIWMYQGMQGFRWVPYFPVDSEPPAKGTLTNAARSFQPIVYSKFGQEQMQTRGVDPLYVPHMVDTKVYRPVDRKAAKEHMGWGDEVFVIGMVADNKSIPSRKCIPQHLEAFRRLHQRHPDTRFYLHTFGGPEKEGYNLYELVQDMGLGDVVYMPEPYKYFCGLEPTEEMVQVFNGIDVLASVSMAEGFGVPILEAQACGTPVITGNWTAMPEISFAGWGVPKEEAEPFMTVLHGYWYTPKITAIEAAFEQAYLNRQDMSEKARRGALQYDADLVAEKYWKPALEEIEAKLQDNSLSKMLEVI